MRKRLLAMLVLVLGLAILSTWAADKPKSGPIPTAGVLRAPCCVCVHRGDQACGSLTVRKDTLRQVYKGKTYYFCDPTCKTLFRRDPEKFRMK